VNWDLVKLSGMPVESGGSGVREEVIGGGRHLEQLYQDRDGLNALAVSTKGSLRVERYGVRPNGIG